MAAHQANADGGGAHGFVLRPLPFPLEQPPPSNPYLFLPPAPLAFPLHTRLLPASHPPREGGESGSSSPSPPPRLLVVGDVHGCLSELQALVARAGLDAARGDRVLIAGDLLAKGPDSRAVLRFVREGGHFAVLGNHEQAVLKNGLLRGRIDGREYGSDAEIALWDKEQVERAGGPDSEAYAAQYYARMNGHSTVARPESEHYKLAGELSDDELRWVARLPLSIDLSHAFSGASDEDTGKSAQLADAQSSTSGAACGCGSACGPGATSAAPWRFTVVHAGMGPGIPLWSQHPHDITTIRNVLNGTLQPVPTPKVGCSWTMPQLAKRSGGEEASKTSAAAAASVAASTDSTTASGVVLPPILFGHDAARGFQYPCPSRLGLDSSAVNGRCLTGLLLPAGRLLSVRSAAVYSEPRKAAMRDTRSPPAEAFSEGGVPLRQVPCAPVEHSRASELPTEPQAAAAQLSQAVAQTEL